MSVLAEKLTYGAFKEMEFPEDDLFDYELINGIIVRKSSPSFMHQIISTNIEYALRTYAKTFGGKMLHAPLDVVLDDNNVYHPDVFFIKKDRLGILNAKEKVVIGAPDLVVEILSKSTARYDKGEKRDIYERYGVREYWLVEEQTNAVEVYSYTDQRYRLIEIYQNTGIVKSITLEGFEIDIEEIFKD